MSVYPSVTFKISNFRKSVGSDENGQLKAVLIFWKKSSISTPSKKIEIYQQISDLKVFFKHHYYLDKKIKLGRKSRKFTLFEKLNVLETILLLLLMFRDSRSISTP